MSQPNIDEYNELEYESETESESESEIEVELDSEPEAPDMVDKYILTERCAGGAFSSVYRGENVRTGAHVAIKTESVDSELGLLRHEARIYMRLRGTPGLFLPKWYGVSTRGLRCLVLPIGPPSLAAHAPALAGMHIGARIALAERVLSALTDVLGAIHDRGMIHRDVKPANTLFDIDAEPGERELTLIDLGLATPWPQTRRPTAFVGSSVFAAAAAHACEPPAPEQDMESATYTALFVREGGSVPWTTTRDAVRVGAAMARVGEIGVVWRAARDESERVLN